MTRILCRALCVDFDRLSLATANAHVGARVVAHELPVGIDTPGIAYTIAVGAQGAMLFRSFPYE